MRYFSSVTRVMLLFCVLITVVSVGIANARATTIRTQKTRAYNLHVSNLESNTQGSLNGPSFTSPVGLNAACQPVCGKGNLLYGQYGNGPVQLQPKAYLIFWGPYWTTTAGKAVATVVRNYFNDASGTKFENILTQYYMINSNNSYSYISNQLQFVNDQTHVWTDSSAPPSDNSCGSSIKTIEDASIKNEVKAAIGRGWPSNDVNTTYFVYTPPGYAVNASDIPKGTCSSPKHFCGYHWGSFSGSAISPPFYAEIVYPGSPNIAPCSSVPNQKSAGDPLANASSHEQFETTTDPELTGWDDPTLGQGGGEIGDKCAGNFTMGKTKLKNGGVFELQGEYSDTTSSCVNSFNPVNTSTDVVPPCSLSAYSLRCAITKANTDGSGDTILFNIPFTDSGCKASTINGQNVHVCTITPATGLPQLLASHTTIDGYTQPGARKNTLPIGSGDNAIITIRIDGVKTSGGLVLNNSASYDTIRGLEITNFSPYGMLLNTSTNTNNTITGNFIGTDGVNALGNGVGIYIGGGSTNNTVGGQTPDTANLISGNTGQGILIGAGIGNTVEGNYVGTDTTGKTAIKHNQKAPVKSPFSGIPNGTGIYIFAQASGNEIGTITAASANIVAYNTYGIVTDNSSNTAILNNTITSNFVGVFAENGETGDSIAENTVANNSTDGILVGNSSTDNVHIAININTIFNNGGLGIDLYPGGTVDCTTATSGGPNDYINCPVITLATPTQISGTACSGCSVEVYVATNEADDQGHGEGKTFLGNATADGNGNWSVSVSLSGGTQITATASTTTSGGINETSEFAANAAVSSSVTMNNIQGSFFDNPNDSGSFDVSPSTTPVFTQSFSVLNFNPSPSIQNCSNSTGVDTYTRPFTEVVRNTDGSCTTVIVQGNGQQAGANSLSSFETEFTATFTVPAAGQLSFDVIADDGWILSIGPNSSGKQPTYVSGPLNNAPSSGPFTGYPVLGANNQASSPVENTVVVNIPSAGTYPIELDYTECCGGELTFVMTGSFTASSQAQSSVSVTTALPVWRSSPLAVLKRSVI